MSGRCVCGGGCLLSVNARGKELFCLHNEKRVAGQNTGLMVGHPGYKLDRRNNIN